MVDAWTQSTMKVWESWVDALTPGAGATASLGRFLPDPEPLTSLLEASAAAWEAMGRQFTTGPQGAVGAYVDQLTKNPFRVPDVGTAAEDMGDLWKLYVETLQTLSRPWMEVSGRAGTLGPAHESGLMQFSDLSWDVLERTFGRLLQSPSIGFTRELNEKLLGAFNAWLEFKRANMDYQVALSAALSRSTAKFLQELAVRAGKGESIDGLRELLRLWGDTLDEVLIESFRSDEFAKVQGRLVRAAMAYRIREREAVDVVLKIGHVPTRRDIDEVARSLYELRKEVRAVSRSVPPLEHEVEGLATSVPGLQKEVRDLAKAVAEPPRPKPAEAKPAEARPVEAKADVKPAEAKAEAMPAEAKPAEAKAKPPVAPSRAKPAPNNKPPAGRGKAAS
jgi:poly[(R)-3-hydroxyalkanoate] polymerase subunit PhaE